MGIFDFLKNKDSPTTDESESGYQERLTEDDKPSYVGESEDYSTPEKEDETMEKENQTPTYTIGFYFDDGDTDPDCIGEKLDYEEAKRIVDQIGKDINEEKKMTLITIQGKKATEDDDEVEPIYFYQRCDSINAVEIQKEE